MPKFSYKEYGRTNSAAFLGDFANREHVLPGGAQLDSAAAFAVEGDVTVTANGVAAVGATSITVDALPASIPAGTVLDFGGEFAVVSATAAAGATSLSVEALGEEIADNSTATYDAGGVNDEIVPAGTLVGRTAAERAAGDSFGPAADADDEIYITLSDVDLAETTDVDLVRHGTLIKTNFLPAYAAASATIKGKLEDKYQLILG